MRSRKNRICNTTAAVIAMGIGTVLFISACSSKATPNTVTREKFQVTQPISIDTMYTREYIAEIQSLQNVEIRARVSCGP